MAIKASKLSLVATLKSHEKLKVMEEEDLLAGMTEGTRVCVCMLPLSLVCVSPSLAVLIHACLVQT